MHASIYSGVLCFFSRCVRFPRVSSATIIGRCPHNGPSHHHCCPFPENSTPDSLFPVDKWCKYRRHKGHQPSQCRISFLNPLRAVISTPTKIAGTGVGGNAAAVKLVTSGCANRVPQSLPDQPPLHSQLLSPSSPHHQFSSKWQLGSQPSPAKILPSSHCSVSSSCWLPRCLRHEAVGPFLFQCRAATIDAKICPTWQAVDKVCLLELQPHGL